MSILIAYGSMTGNTELCANSIQTFLNEKNIATEIKPLHEVEVSDLNNYEKVILGVSTQGDGEYPVISMGFFEGLKNTESLTSKYIIFGLGDTVYEKFCKASDMASETIKSKGGNVIADTMKIDGLPTDEIMKDLNTYIEENLNK